MLELTDVPLEECFVCFYETEHFVIFECLHKVCPTCFPKLRSPDCPVCSRPIVVLSSPRALPLSTGTNVAAPRCGIIVIVSVICAIFLWTKRNLIF